MTKNTRNDTEFVASTNSRIGLGESSDLSEASQTRPGLMNKQDFHKLNNLVIPPPTATLSSSDCSSRIRGGVLEFKSGDEFIKVESHVRIKQNEDGSTAPIYTSIPLHIHGNTYGLRFSLDVEALSRYLIGQNRLVIKGPIGERGEDGLNGEAGEDYILSGPRGDSGISGSAPINPYELEVESLGVVPIGTTAITQIVPEILDDNSYSLATVRQPVGDETVSASKIENTGTSTKWAVVVDRSGDNQTPYYLDIEPIERAIAARASEHAALISKGYEDAVRFWINTMSELFDSQKAALCCAIEAAVSKTKNIEDRRHWEATAAAAKPEYAARRKFRPDSNVANPSTELEVINSSHTLNDLYADNQLFLHPGQINRPLVSIPCFDDSETVNAVQDSTQENNSDALIQPNFGLISTFKSKSYEPQAINHGELPISIDAKYNSGYPTDGAVVVLPKGEYQLRVVDTNARFSEGYGAPLRIMTISGMASLASDFVDYGFFDTLEDSKNRYNDSAILINHDGGPLKVYIPIKNSAENAGQIVVGIIPRKIVLKPTELKQLKVSENYNYATYANINIEFSVEDLKYTKEVTFILEGDVLVPTKINS